MSSKRMTRSLLVALALAVLAVAPACTDAQKEQMAANAAKRQRTMAEKQLKERASEYWNLVRWRTWDNAASYLEEDAAQLAFLRRHTDVGVPEGPSLQDLEVQYVFVGTGAEEGEIRVTWTEVVATEGRVADKTVTQRWYKHHGKWWVDPNETLGRVEVGALDESAAPEEPPADLPTETPEASTP